MFDKEYSFRGRHAEKVSRLTAEFDKGGNKLFSRNYDVYLLAPIVGFLYGVKSEIDKEGDKIIRATKIFPDILMKNKDDLLFNYRLIMLLDKNNEPNFEERVNKAFRYYGSDKTINDELLYEQYVRGGVDKIYEKIFDNAQNLSDYLKNLFLFIDEVEDRYNSVIDKDCIKKLCRLAKG